MDQDNEQRTPDLPPAAAQVDSRQPGAELWHFATMGEVFASPVVRRDRVYVASARRILALDSEEGSSVWPAERAVDLKEWTAAGMDAGSDRLYVSVTDERALPRGEKPVLAFDLGSGEQAWSYATSALKLSAPTLKGGVLYVNSSDKKLHAINTNEGTALWARDVGVWGPSAPAVAGNIIALGAQELQVTALSAADGRILWTAPTGEWAVPSPAIAGDVIYACAWDGCLYALDALSGKQIWVYKSEKPLLSAPTVYEDRVYVGGRNKCLIAIDAGSGKEVWRASTNGHIYTRPTIDGEVIYVGSSDHHFYAFNIATGQPLPAPWPFEAKGKIRAAPVIDRGRLFLGSLDGNLYSLATGEQMQSRSAAEWEATGALARAAAAYAGQGDPANAGRCYQQAGMLAEAIAAYRAAGSHGDAGRVCEAAGLNDDAINEFEQAGEWRAAAGLCVRIQRLDKAADCLAAIPDYGAAGQQYEAAGMLDKAFDMYIQAGDKESADRIDAKVTDLRQLVAVAERRSNHTRVAVLRERLGELLPAAEAYERAGDCENAGRLQARLENWQNAQRLYALSGNKVGQAQALVKLGEIRQAAALYVAAAQDQEATGADDDVLAGLYDEASVLFQRVYDGESAAVCRDRLICLRKLPAVALEVQAESGLRVEEFSKIRCTVRNDGCGVAIDISVSLEGKFEGDIDVGVVKDHLDGLAPGKSHDFKWAIMPHAKGQDVPIRASITFRDDKQREYHAGGRYYISVSARDESPRTPTGPIIQITTASQVLASAGPIINDSVLVRSQVGGTTAPQNVSPLPGHNPISVDSGQASAVEPPHCPKCGAELPPDAKWCNKCGAKVSNTA